MRSMSRRGLLRSALAGLGTLITGVPYLSGSAAAPARRREYSFHFDHVLGTSLDIWISATAERVAHSAVDVVLAEIERLRRVFSPVDPDSELGRLNRTHHPIPVSPEMIAVLSA